MRKRRRAKVSKVNKVSRAKVGLFGRGCLALSLCLVCPCVAAAQGARRAQARAPEFGPIVRAYLDYLRAQQEVVDDRVSRREVDRRYYLHNSNRIRALRQVAIRIARENDNDYLPELEAVSLDEFEQLFEEPLPEPTALRVGETLRYQFRFLEAVTVQREKFYVFARLDPYEQAELRKQGEAKAKAEPRTEVAPTPTPTDSATRPRRANSPE
jgi:hypothetical protein